MGHAKNIVAAGFIGMLVFSFGAEAKLYKWVDNDGSTHYGEVIPPEYATNNKASANTSGARDKRIEIVNSEMMRAKEEDSAKKAAAMKEMEEKKRRDLALLNTYSSEKEIDEALERSLALINARIESNNILLKSSQDKLGELKKEFDSRSREGKKIPQSLYDDISLTEANITKHKLERTKSEEVLVSTKARYENDKVLYRRIVVVKSPNIPENNDASEYAGSNDSAYYPDSSNTYKHTKRAKKRY